MTKIRADRKPWKGNHPGKNWHRIQGNVNWLKATFNPTDLGSLLSRYYIEPLSNWRGLSSGLFTGIWSLPLFFKRLSLRQAGVQSAERSLLRIKRNPFFYSAAGIVERLLRKRTEHAYKVLRLCFRRMGNDVMIFRVERLHCRTVERETTSVNLLLQHFCRNITVS